MEQLVQLPPADSGVYDITIKNNYDAGDTVRILDVNEHQIEDSTSPITLTELNECVVLSSDGGKWNIISWYKPSRDRYSSQYVAGTSTNFNIIPEIDRRIVSLAITGTIHLPTTPASSGFYDDFVCTLINTNVIGDLTFDGTYRANGTTLTPLNEARVNLVNGEWIITGQLT